ncbi:MAG TPA: hypothetical protein PLE30_07965 [Candidatus Kapabacteria bacterium]|nr:hypothetical protein [Candidatus Kapabacteria bacterium]
MKKISAFILLCFIYLLISCESNPVNSNAELMDIAVLSKTPGYQWFDLEIEKYQPDANVITQLQSAFTNPNDSIIIFVKPSCSCPGTQQYFPALIKTLREANIPLANYKVYSMNSKTANHPYENIFKVNELPTFFLKNGNNAVYSISDTFYLSQEKKLNYKLEELLLQAIQK